jgi:hypothetical protein
MAHRADHRRAIDDLGGLRQQLADPKGGDGGVDAAQVAADFQRRRRLDVEGLKLAGRAVKIQQDARLCPAEGGRRLAARLLGRPQQIGQRQSGRS